MNTTDVFFFIIQHFFSKSVSTLNVQTLEIAST